MDPLEIDQNLLTQVIQKFLQKESVTLSAAESCTGGLFSATLTSRPGVSRFFKGALVSYSNDLKEKWLAVPSSLLLTMGAVSLPVAKYMARGARLQTLSTWSVSVTGVAGPNGGTATKPVGTVCFALCGPGIEVAEEVLFPYAQREEIQRASVNHMLGLIAKHLS